MEAKLYIVCGISGSGKSTVAKNLEAQIANSILLSSDALRAIIGKSEEDQDVSPIVFGTMKTMTEYLLKRGRTVIIDATNTTIKARNRFTQIARKIGVQVTVVAVEIEVATAKARNAQRSRKVPEEVIDRQFEKFVLPTQQEVDRIIIMSNNGPFAITVLTLP